MKEKEKGHEKGHSFAYTMPLRLLTSGVSSVCGRNSPLSLPMRCTAIIEDFDASGALHGCRSHFFTRTSLQPNMVQHAREHRLLLNVNRTF